MRKVNKLKKIFDEAYISLARNRSLWQLNQTKFLQLVCKAVAETLNVEHIAIYLLNQEETKLQQVTHYSLSQNCYSSGLSFKKENHPLYFESLRAFRIIDAADAQHDIRTREFSNSYITPQGIGAMLDCTLHHGGKLSGVICAEHLGHKRKWQEAEKNFLISIADLVSQRLLFDEMHNSYINYSELSAFDEAVVKSSNNCILSLDKDGTIRTFNHACNVLLGDNSEQLIGQDFFTKVLVQSPQLDKASQTQFETTISDIFDVDALRKNIAEGLPSNCDAFFQHSSGQVIPVSMVLNTIRDTNNKLKGYVCIATDLSQSLNNCKTLEAKEERYHLLFEGNAESLFLMRNDRFTECNSATLKLFRCSKEQLINKTPYDFSPEFQADGRRSEDSALEKITAALRGEVQTFEWEHLRYDGTPFTAEVTLNKITMSGEPFIFSSLRDIDSRKIWESELEKSREKIVEHNEALALINTLSNQLHATDSIDEIFSQTMETLEWMPRSPRIGIYSIDAEAQMLRFVIGTEYIPNAEADFRDIPINPKFNGLPIESGEPIYSSSIANDERIVPEYRDKILDLGIKAMVEIPFVYQEQKIAVAFLTYEIENPLTPENVEVLYSIGKTVSLALVNAQTRSELGYIAHHDSLTGLSNRAYYHKQFKSTILSGNYKNVALFLLDLDRFKEINDTLGHFTGDKVLQQIGPRLEALIQNRKVLVSRLGGDEFIILVYGISDNGEAHRIAKKILNCIQEPFPIDDLNLEIDTSIGIAIYPKDGMDSHALLRSADVAMYQAKQLGKGYMFYEQQTDIHTPERLAMIAEMGSSISSGQLFLHYQPKINLNDSKVIGFEALARWDHPRLGILGPSMFIPLIEMSNSIFQLTEEVLHQALSQQMQWRKEGFNYSVAVNLSARNLIDDRIIHLLKDMLIFYDTPPNMLELEITETALMHDAYRATEYLKQLSDLGIQLSIDDFGTGYSSLAYLHRLPIHKLKLDRAFIMGMLNNEQGSSIVETIISLSRTLDLEVIAEGVEDQGTLDRLVLMNCSQAQGYHICRPNSWENIQHWLKRKGKITESII